MRFIIGAAFVVTLLLAFASATQFACRDLDVARRASSSLAYAANVDATIQYFGHNSLRKLTRIGFECYVAKSYEQGKLTLREAARLLTLPLSETIGVLSEMGVKGNIRSSEVLESLRPTH